jgi:O-antigen ligase
VLSFYIRFPVDKSIITFDRVMIALAAALALFRWHREKSRAVASKFEILWAMLSAAALLSALLASDEVAPAIRLAFDSFCLPLVVFRLARHHFDLRGRGSAILGAAMVVALLLMATGGVEFVSGMNLFPYKGSEILRGGEIRVNGPFLSDSSYAAVCMLIALFLRNAPLVFRVRFDRSGRFTFVCATAAAALGSLIVLFRTVAAARVFCWIAMEFLNRRRAKRDDSNARARRLAAYASVVLMVVSVWYAASGSAAFARRLASAESAYGRLATWQAAVDIALEKPVTGVGLGNYTAYFLDKYYVRDDEIEAVNEIRAARSPHSNALWIAAELGATGLALYLAAWACLFFACWRASNRAVDIAQRAAASCALALVAAYTLVGMTLTAGAYSDLNLCLFFLTGLLLNAGDKK